MIFIYNMIEQKHLTVAQVLQQFMFKLLLDVTLVSAGLENF